MITITVNKDNNKTTKHRVNSPKQNARSIIYYTETILVPLLHFILLSNTKYT